MDLIKAKIQELLSHLLSLQFWASVAAVVSGVMAAQQAGMFPADQLPIQLLLGLGGLIIGVRLDNGKALVAKAQDKS